MGPGFYPVPIYIYICIFIYIYTYIYIYINIKCVYIYYTYNMTLLYDTFELFNQPLQATLRPQSVSSVAVPPATRAASFLKKDWSTWRWAWARHKISWSKLVQGPRGFMTRVWLLFFKACPVAFMYELLMLLNSAGSYSKALLGDPTTSDSPQQNRMNEWSFELWYEF